MSSIVSENGHQSPIAPRRSSPSPTRTTSLQNTTFDCSKHGTVSESEPLNVSVAVSLSLEQVAAGILRVEEVPKRFRIIDLLLLYITLWSLPDSIALRVEIA